MARRIVGIVLLFVALSFSFGGCALKKWHTYENRDMGFKIDYPKDWFVLSNFVELRGPFEVSSTPLSKYGHGGIPPRVTMEVAIYEGCSYPTKEWETVYILEENSGPYFLRKLNCFSNFQVILDLWGSDPEEEERDKKLLEKVASTFRVAAK